MNKSLTMRYMELKDAIADLINESGLPAFIIEPMIKDFARELNEAAVRQYQYDCKQYEIEMTRELEIAKEAARDAMFNSENNSVSDAEQD